MVLTVRLEPELETRIEQVSRQKGVSKSEWVRQALKSQLHADERPDPYQAYLRIKAKSRARASGVGDLSTNARTYLRDKVRAKRAR